jgi:predicted nucleic acid-binding protein
MTLTDTGALVALLDEDDAGHAACTDALERLPSDILVTTWPCFTEAMYLLGRVGEWRYQEALWKLIQTQDLVLHDLTAAEIDRVAELMEKYQDTPMDLADASLVIASDSLALREVFTLDSDFRIYRLSDGSTLSIIP